MKYCAEIFFFIIVYLIIFAIISEEWVIDTMIGGIMFWLTITLSRNKHICPTCGGERY